MTTHPGFMVTYRTASGGIRKHYVPPCSFLTGPERRQKSDVERQTFMAKSAFARYWPFIQRRVKG